MTADVIDLKTPAGKIYAEDHPARIAQEYVSGNPKFFLWLNLVAAIIAVLAAGLLDVCLIYSVQSERFHDAYNNFVGSVFVLCIVSLVTLAIFWLIGEGWDNGGVWRRLAVGGYILLIFLLMVLLFPSYGQTISDLWDGRSNASVFILNNHNRAEAPQALVWFFVAVVAMAYSSGGLLWLIGKKYLGRSRDALKNFKEAKDRCDLVAEHAAAMQERRRLQLDVEHQEANEAALANEVIAAGLNEYRAEIDTRRKQAESTLRSIKTSKSEKQRAKHDLGLLEACNRSLSLIKIGILALILASGQPLPAQADPTVEILAHAPVFQLLIDVSGGSPALNPDYLGFVLPQIQKRLEDMPLGTTVVVSSFGDAALPPLMFRSRLQAKHTSEGDTPEHVARDLRELVLSFPERMHGKEQKRSELVGGFFDSAQAINPKAHGNVILAISDLVENSPLARCDNEKAKPCKLPPPVFHLPPDTTVCVYGVGQGLHSDRAALLTQQWAVFFKKAGVGAVLRRN
jgi:hypothetical protein